MLLVVAAALTMTTRIPWTAYTERAVTARPVSLTYVFAPIPVPSTTRVQLSEGLEVVQPLPTDQCWTVYPLCTPNVSPTLELRGADVSEGFTQ